MNILFICYEIPDAPASYPLGPGLLSALLKKRGHTVNGLYIHKHLSDEVIGEVVRKVHEHKPDLLAYSFSSPSSSYIVLVAKKLKELFGLPSICGGAHPTLYPEETLSLNLFDYLAVGEAEVSFPKFIETIEQGGELSKVLGIWTKNEGSINRNALNPLVVDLDTLENTDYDLFGKEFITDITRDGWLRIISSRGCPYSCSYCHTPLFRRQYSKYINVSQSNLHYVRSRSALNIINEINKLVDRYDVNVFNFMDDLFCLNKQRTVEFCNLFKEIVPEHVGYSIQTHLFHLDKNIIQHLKASRCLRVVVGFESGSDRILKLLNRKTSAETARDKLQMLVLSHFPLGTWTLNMLGLPSETLDEMHQTLKINAQALIDKLKVNIFSPYPGSKLYQYCLEKDLFLGTNSIEFQDRWITKLKFPTKELSFLVKFFDIGHWYMNMFAPLDVKDEFADIIEEAERVDPKDWTSARDQFLRRDVVLLEKLAKNKKDHYEVVFKGKVTAHTIGLVTY